MKGNKKSNESLTSCKSQLTNKMSSSSSASYYDNSENNNSILDKTLFVQWNIQNDDSNNEWTLFPLSIVGNDWHTLGIAANKILNNKIYTNEYNKQKKWML